MTTSELLRVSDDVALKSSWNFVMTTVTVMRGSATESRSLPYTVTFVPPLNIYTQSTHLFTTDKGGGTCFCPCLSVYLLARLLKTRAWIWMKCCVSTDVGTWTNWLTFEPDPSHSPDAGTGLLSPTSYRLRNFAALPRVPASCAATRNFTSGKILRTRNGGAPLERAVVLKWFYSLSRRKSRPLSEVNALYRVSF